MSSLNPSLRLALIKKTKSQKNILQKGFTLVELLIVVVILGTLAGIALPTYLAQSTKAKINGAESQVKAAASACVAAIVSDTASDFSAPAGVTMSSCAANGTFTSNITGLTRQAVATITNDQVSITQTAQ